MKPKTSYIIPCIRFKYLQIRYIGLALGLDSKIKKCLSVKAELNLRFSLWILRLRVKKDMFLEGVSWDYYYHY